MTYLDNLEAVTAATTTSTTTTATTTTTSTTTTAISAKACRWGVSLAGGGFRRHLNVSTFASPWIASGSGSGEGISDWIAYGSGAMHIRD